MARSKTPKLLTTQQQIELACKNLRSLRWDVDYKYDTDCSECDANDYHRNCVIKNFRIESVNMKKISASVLANVHEPILGYCIDRILHISEMYNTYSWDYQKSSGYYGEEIDDVTFTGASSIDERIWELAQMTDVERILKVLEWEYGSILPILKTVKSFAVENVEIADVALPNDHYVAKVKVNSRYEQGMYDEWELPLGICVPVSNGQVKVVDGYHRVTKAISERAAIKKGDTILQVIVGR